MNEHEDQTDLPNIVVVVKGGVVQCVYSDQDDITCEIVDHDNGEEDEETAEYNDTLLDRIKKNHFETIY